MCWMAGSKDQPPANTANIAQAVLAKVKLGRKNAKAAVEKEFFDELFEGGMKKAHRWTNAPNVAHDPGRAKDGSLNESSHLEDNLAEVP